MVWVIITSPVPHWRFRRVSELTRSTIPECPADSTRQSSSRITR